MQKIEQQSPARLRIAPDTYENVAADLQRFVVRYNAEHAGRMAPIVLDDDKYRRISASGILRGFAARDGDRVVGVISYVLVRSPHYHRDYLIARQDFFYVEPEYRHSFVPLGLLRVAERELEKAGARVIFTSDHIRFQNRSEAFKRMGYTPVEIVYEKRLQKLPG